MTQNNNPFPVELIPALDGFFETLIQQQRKKLLPDKIKKESASLDEALLLEMDQAWSDILDLMEDGLKDRVVYELQNFLVSYARHKALEQFFKAGANGPGLSRATPKLEEALKQDLIREHRKLSSMLLRVQHHVQRNRENTDVLLAQPVALERMRLAEQSALREFQRNEHIVEAWLKTVKELGEQNKSVPGIVLDALGDARLSLADARASLALAQEQAVKLAESAAGIANSYKNHVEQREPYAMEAAVVRAEKKKHRDRLFWVLFTLGVMVALPCIALFIIQFI